MKRVEFNKIKELIIDEINRVREVYAGEDPNNHEIQLGFLDSISAVEYVCEVVEKQYPFDK